VLNDSGSGIEHPAAVIVETVQGEGGLNAARASWLRELAELCKRHDILLIVDDVQAGCGRTGTFFSFEEAGITPDIVCLSKSLSGFGLPLAVTLLRPELDQWVPGEHNGTFRGQNPSFVTGKAALERFWTDDVFAKATAEKSTQLREGLVKIADKYEDAQVRGRGMLQGIAYPDYDVAGAIAKAAFERGLLVETSGPESEVVKVMPALTIEPADLERGIDVLAEAADSVFGKRAS
jgi:diaminobutyrate-2-oxoglutarate transaminase